MKKLLVIALSAMMLFAFTACQPGSSLTEDEGTGALMEYLGSFGHVRVLSDMSTVLAGTEVTGMKLADNASTAIVEGETESTLTLPFVLENYDFDGHANDDATGENYLRTATGNATLVLTGTVAEGVFTVNHWEYTDVNLDLKWNDGDEDTENDKIDPITVTTGSVSGMYYPSATISVGAENAATGITNASTAKFVPIWGSLTVDGSYSVNIEDVFTELIPGQN